MSNLFNNNNSGKHYGNWQLTDKNYYDFFIYDHSFKGNNNVECLVGEINPNIEGCIDDNCTEKECYIYSTTIWDKAENTGIDLADFGFCSVDNGYTHWDSSNNNPPLEEVFIQTTLTIPEDDKRFFMKPVDGFYYNIDYSWDIEQENNQKYFTFKGGFLQGFYKLYFGTESNIIKYQTLPNRPEKAWVWEFMIRPKHLEKQNTLNFFFPDNYGFFFYQGLRAENKWWYYSNKLNIDRLELLKQTLEQNQENYFLNDYLDIEELSKNKSIYETLQTSSGILLNTSNITEFKTNNKFIFFNRTCCGETIKTYNETKDYVVSYQKRNPNLNFFLLFDRTKDGITTRDVEPSGSCCSYNSQHLYKEYDCNSYLRYNLVDKPKQNFPELLKDIDLYDNTIDILKDIYSNHMGFRITENGQISYRFLIKNCEEDREKNPYKIIEEYSKENIIQYDKWNYVVIKFVFDEYISNPECSNKLPRKGKLYFYNNGNLVFISKQIDEPVFHELNEYWEKQQSIPYNISLGGGSQGLLETILSDNPYDYDRYVFPIEKNFAGTFYGNIMWFKINNCDIPVNQIKNNWRIIKLKLS